MGRKGSALLAVMWMSAALAAIAFSLSTTVRGEAERASSELDSVRAYFLAEGAVERAMLDVVWSIGPGADHPLKDFTTAIDYSFATGTAHVDLLAQAGKLSLNDATPEELDRLMLALGAPPAQAAAVAEGIVAWRSPVPAEAAGQTTAANSTQGPSFQAPHASFQEIEELLLVRGVTPDLFYGSFAPAGGPDGPLMMRQGLIDCLSPFGTKEQVDINTAPAAVLEAVGVPPAAIGQIVERRKVKPFTSTDFAGISGDLGPGAQRLKAGGNSIATLKATARLRPPNGGTSDVKRTVAAMVKFMPPGWDSPVHVLRWWDYSVGSN
jgi:general secretion pathway protein K